MQIKMKSSKLLNTLGHKIALVHMPFANLHCPSMAMGQLKPIVENSGLACDDIYANLELTNFISPEKVQEILELDQYLLGDYLFSQVLGWNECSVENSEYLNEIVKREGYDGTDSEKFIEFIHSLMNETIPSYIDWLLDSRDWSTYKAIGFTSTFQQQTATLAFAKKLSINFPQIPIIAGGANFHGIMGKTWIETENAIDYVCDGEGDTTFVELLTRLDAGGTDLHEVPNLIYRDKTGRVRKSDISNLTVSLDSLPYPDFDTYYTTSKSVGLTNNPLWGMHSLTIEGSRGCWWGQKHHCVFCGLNNDGMQYRAKSPKRFVEEVLHLSSRYLCTSFQAVDNILDRKYQKTVIDFFSENKSDIRFFFEVKSNLSFKEIRDLRKAGVIAIQPGIESLNSDVLSLMRKGVTGIQNIFLLKWAKYFRISVAWNLLCNFQHETDNHYLQQLQWIPLLHHLDPPNARARVILERYSPMFESPEQFEFSNTRPHRYYESIYGNKPSLENIAYYFEYDKENPVSSEIFDKVDKSIEIWKEAYKEKHTLTYRWSPSGFIEITDTRYGDKHTRYVYKSPMSEIYEIAGIKISTPSSIAKFLKNDRDIDLDVATIESILKRFVDRGLMINEGNKYVSLALPVSNVFNESEQPRSKASNLDKLDFEKERPYPITRIEIQ